MIYITGDTHGDFSRFFQLKDNIHLQSNDMVIILGDAGLNYFGYRKDRKLKQKVNNLGCTFFCIHGNHEKRPKDCMYYKTKEFYSGIVWYEEEFPNLLFAKDGEIYRIGNYDCIVLGGAYSIDKEYRLITGQKWFWNEQPSDDIKAYVSQQLQNRNHQIDIVLSHTCPLKYEPTEVFLRGIDQDTVDKSTEIWLDKVESTLTYKKWYCGHYHITKAIDKIQFLYEDIYMFNVD